MRTISRRSFLAASLAFAATSLRARSEVTAHMALKIPRDATGPDMPIDFIGLSYEVQQLAAPSFFTPNNIGLIRQFKALASRGVLRLGGNTSEFAWWKPAPSSPEPDHPQCARW